MLKDTYFSALEKTRKENPDALFVAVSRSIPKWYPKELAWYKELAPSYNLLNDYKHGKISWDEYTRRFKEEMNSDEAKWAMEVIKEYSKDADVYLVCWESPRQNCHRHILVEMITGEKKEKQGTLGV